MPTTTIERNDILVGHLEDETPFKLDLEDFFRHVYIVVLLEAENRLR